MFLDPAAAPIPPPRPPGTPAPPTIVPKSRPLWPLVIAAVPIGLVSVILSFLASGNYSDNPARRLGYVMGGTIFLPLIVMALFAIGKRFRTTRSQLIILIAVWLLGWLSGFGNLSQSIRASHAARDNALVAELNARTADIRHRLLEADSSSERAALQAELGQAYAEILPKFSPERQPTMRVTCLLVDPLIDEGQAYTRAVGEFFDSPASHFSNVATPEELDERRARVDALDMANQHLIDRYNRLEDDVERLLIEHQVDAVQRAAFLKGFRNSRARQNESVLRIRDLDTQVYALLRARIDLLHDEWGRWQVDDQGVLIWETEDLLDRYRAIQAAISELASEQIKLQQELLSLPSTP